MKKMTIQEKRDRLQHIQTIWNNTFGWSKQLFNLYEERQRLIHDIANYNKVKETNSARDGIPTSRINAQKSLIRRNMGST